MTTIAVDQKRKEPSVTAPSATRPLLHFAPEQNWMNDPNGLVFHKGRYHLFYQCNPEGVVHANLSWGHASSTDLIDWEHHPVAIRDDEAGQIFSGSVVVDVGNTSGLGTTDDPALVALYTQAAQNPNRQSQALAYSIDDGLTWTKYAGNPVLDRGTSDFRDPKVFRYDGPAGAYWVMVAVEAVDRQAMLYRSDDLINWTFLSAFGPQRAVDGVWECPDLFPLAVEGDPGDVRWVLLISLNPGGIAGGSGTQYFIGDFDGVTFAADDDATGDAIDWLDFGRDCYAGVTFDALAQADRTLIAWMSNWDYVGSLHAADGTLRHPMMTLPRRLSLVSRDGSLRLRQQPVSVQLADERVLEDIPVAGSRVVFEEIPDAGRISVRIDVLGAAGFALRLRFDGADEGVVMLTYDADARQLSVGRTDGNVAIHDDFPGSQMMPVAGGNLIDLEIWLDRASIEVFADGGTRVLTDLLAPQHGRALAVEGVGGQVHIERIAVADAVGPDMPIG